MQCTSQLERLNHKLKIRTTPTLTKLVVYIKMFHDLKNIHTKIIYKY